MKERPIIFNAEMVRAILEGRKTQTRRPVKGENLNAKNAGELDWWIDSTKCPYGEVGDRLWVRETHHVPGGFLDTHLIEEIREGISTPESLGIMYRADMPNMHPCDGGWAPSIHMPRWASRITLEITGIRVERVQEITDDEAKAEGVGKHGGWNADETEYGVNHRGPFSLLWESIYGNWKDNPFVWVIEFKRLEAGR